MANKMNLRTHRVLPLASLIIGALAAGFAGSSAQGAVVVPPASRVGDVDGDGILSLNDVRLALLDSLGVMTLPDDQRAIAALGGKKPTRKNALSILRAMLGWEALPWVAIGGSYIDGPAFLPDGTFLYADYDKQMLTALAPNGDSSTYMKSKGRPAALETGADGQLYLSEFSGGIYEIGPDRVPKQLAFFAKGSKDYVHLYGIVHGREGRIYTTGQDAFVYLLKPDGTTQTIIQGLMLSTGLAVTPDHHLRVAEAQGGRIMDFTLGEDGLPVGVGKVWAKAPTPNGIQLDRMGRLWVATFYAHQIHVFSPEGKLLRKIDVPHNVATSVTFGPPGSHSVYVTSTQPCGVDIVRLSPTDPLAAGLP